MHNSIMFTMPHVVRDFLICILGRMQEVAEHERPVQLSEVGLEQDQPTQNANERFVHVSLMSKQGLPQCTGADVCTKKLRGVKMAQMK